jgi:hypothetical protein
MYNEKCKIREVEDNGELHCYPELVSGSFPKSSNK